MRVFQLLFAAGSTPNAPTSPPPPPPPPPGAPAAPTDLALSSRTATTWTGTYTDNSSTETGFKIFADGTQKGTAAANATTITASSLTEGTQYAFTVKATNSGTDSPASNTVNSYTLLATPTGFAAVLSGGIVTFSWTNASTNYTEVAIVKNGSVHDTVAKGTTTYQVAEGSAAGTWKVRARASGIPDSADSGSVTGPPWPE